MRQGPAASTPERHPDDVDAGSAASEPALGGAMVSAVRWGDWRLHLLVTLAWAGALVVSTWVSPDGIALHLALALHVLGLVIALGSVLLVDWYGLAWMAGFRSLRDCLRLAEAAHPLIWLGTILLLASGAGLSPDPASPLTWVKQVLVLALLHNGVALRAHSRRMAGLGAARGLRDFPPGVRARVVASVAVSQAAWWGATLLGFVTASQRAL